MELREGGSGFAKRQSERDWTAVVNRCLGVRRARRPGVELPSVVGAVPSKTGISAVTSI